MFDIYTQGVMNHTNAKSICKKIHKLRIIKDLLVIEYKTKQQEQDYIKLKSLIEYKYGIPIEHIPNKKYLKFCAYSTHKMLKLLLPHLKLKGTKKYSVHRAIAKSRDAKINIYSAGAIEKCTDGGVGHRKKLIKSLERTNTNIINPCDFEYNEKFTSMKAFQEKNSFIESYWHFRNIVKNDLYIVNQVDMVVLYLDQNIGFGSTSEASVTTFLNKPLYAIMGGEMSIGKVNPWLLGCVTRFFKDFDDFRNFLLKI